MHCPLPVPLHLSTRYLQHPANSMQAMPPRGHAEAACGENGKDSHNMPTSQPQQPFTQPRLNRLPHLIRNARKDIFFHWLERLISAKLNEMSGEWGEFEYWILCPLCGTVYNHKMVHHCHSPEDGRGRWGLGWK